MRRVFIVIGLCTAAHCLHSFNGTGNNVRRELWGSSGTPYLRRDGLIAYYTDRTGADLAQSNTGRPAAFQVSNDIFVQDDAAPVPADANSLTELFAYWGQWVTFDLTWTEDATPLEAFPLEGFPQRFKRAAHLLDQSGVRQQLNSATAFIDGEAVYGNSEMRAAALRTFKGGLLRVSDTNGLPSGSFAKTCGCRMSNPRNLSVSELEFTGNVRSNVDSPIAALQLIFLREHNRLCGELTKSHPDWSDQQLYDRARARVIATLQKITMYEYLPLLIGPAVPPYAKYDADLEPAIETFFVAAAFRFGHSTMSSTISLLDENAHIVNTRLLRSMLFSRPSDASHGGLEQLLRGLLNAKSQPVDTKVVDDLRAHLTSPAGAPDLVALNVMRGRDFGLPPYNEVRRAYGLQPISNWDELTSDNELRSKLQRVYGPNVSSLDAFVGMLAEPPLLGVPVGELCRAALAQQFSRVRDGDRFWHEGAATELSAEEVSNLPTLGDVIARNTFLLASEVASPFVLRPHAPSGDTKNATDNTGSGSFLVDAASGRLVTWRRASVPVPSHTFTFAMPVDSWQAIGFAPKDGAMLNADILMVQVGTRQDSNTTGCASLDQVLVCDRNAYGWKYSAAGLPRIDVDSPGGTLDVELLSVSMVNGMASVEFRRPEFTQDRYDTPLSGSILCMFAWGSGSRPYYHEDRTHVSTIDFSTGSTGSSELPWRQQMKLLHGSMMGSIWGLNVVVGVFVARYERHTTWWFGTHRMLQTLSTLITWPMYYVGASVRFLPPSPTSSQPSGARPSPVPTLTSATSMLL
jgi:hypothetical protein